jgi:serine/threonine protein kinase
MTSTTPWRAIDERYVWHEELGHGGMARVHRMFDRVRRQLVAMKRPLRTGRADSLLDDLSVAREFVLLSHLDHPGLIDVLDFGHDADGHPFFTMPLDDEAAVLADVAHTLGPTAFARRMVEVLRALAHLHAHGIVHRDVKPDNVLLVGGRAKLIDLGLAARTGTLCEPAGTLRFMPPETLCASETGPAVDVYAVGCMLRDHPSNPTIRAVASRLTTPCPTRRLTCAITASILLELALSEDRPAVAA